jgi:N-acetylglutamate synthase-like GNAT family acetyltransferase
MIVMKQEVHLRPEKLSDLPFLRALFATTRVDVMFSDLPDAQKQQFLEMQFNAQRNHYRSHYENAKFLIVEQGGRAIGRLYVAYLATEIRVIDISIMPDHRNQGVGSNLLRTIQSEARATGLPVTLHAEKLGNLAAYYERFGFEILEEKELHFLMKWTTGATMIITPDSA